MRGKCRSRMSDFLVRTKERAANTSSCPPDYTGAVPEGYLVYRPQTYAVEVAFRPVAKNGGTIEEVVEYGKSLKIYKLSEAANPPKTRFIDAYPKKWNTLPTYDINYFKDRQYDYSEGASPRSRQGHDGAAREYRY